MVTRLTATKGPVNSIDAYNALIESKAPLKRVIHATPEQVTGIIEIDGKEFGVQVTPHGWSP